MPTGSRELPPSRLYEIARTLADTAAPAAVPAALVRMQLDMPQGNFPPNAAPLPDWLATVQAAHSGLSAKAGYRADAVARVVAALADTLAGNAVLAQLAHDLGTGGVNTTPGQRAIFLSYASTDRAGVDALHAALTAADPGLTLFQDYRSIPAGQAWLDCIRTAAGSAAAMVCWVTPTYVQRTFCSYEIGTAEGRGSAIIPIWVDGLAPNSAPAYLAARQGRKSDAPHAFADLAAWLTASI